MSVTMLCFCRCSTNFASSFDSCIWLVKKISYTFILINNPDGVLLLSESVTVKSLCDYVSSVYINASYSIDLYSCKW